MLLLRLWHDRWAHGINREGCGGLAGIRNLNIKIFRLEINIGNPASWRGIGHGESRRIGAAAAKRFGSDDTRPVKLFFQDEGRFGRMSNLASCWAPEGIRPHLEHQIVRQYTHVFSAVCPEDGESFSLTLPYADTEAMTIFLEAFSKEYSKYRVVIIMDQAAWHKLGNLCRHENI